MRSNDDTDMTNKELTDLRQRALYRACYRGTREMDFLLGRFAKAVVEDMGITELSAFENMMELPEPVLMAALVDGVGEFEDQTEVFIERIRQFHKKCD